MGVSIVMGVPLNHLLNLLNLGVSTINRPYGGTPMTMEPPPRVAQVMLASTKWSLMESNKVVPKFFAKLAEKNSENGSVSGSRKLVGGWNPTPLKNMTSSITCIT